MTEQASVSASMRGDTRVVHLRGEVDMANAADVFDALCSCSDDAPDVVIDLSRVTYLDSAGIRMVSELMRRFEDEARAIAFALPEHATCRRVIELTLPGLPIVPLD